MAYTDQTKIETKLGQSLPSDISSDDLNVYINEVEAYIDAYTNTTFEGSGSTSRIYSTLPWSQYVIIDPYVSITSVEYLSNRSTSGDTWTAYETTSYRQEPENTTPKRRLKFFGISYSEPAWIEGGTANIRVTGVLGYSTTVPLDVQAVATSMVIDMLRERGDIDKGIRQERLGDVSFTYNGQTFEEKRLAYNRTLDRYKNYGDIRL